MWVLLLKSGEEGTISCNGTAVNKTTTWGKLEKEELSGKLADVAKSISRQTVENTNSFF